MTQPMRKRIKTAMSIQQENKELEWFSSLVTSFPKLLDQQFQTSLKLQFKWFKTNGSVADLF